MPYEQYLASAATSSYGSRTFSSSELFPAFATAVSNTRSGDGDCGPNEGGSLSFSETNASGYSSGGGQQAQGGLYSYSRRATGSTAASGSFALNWAGGGGCTLVPENTSGLNSGNSGATDSESVATAFGSDAITISGDSLLNNTNQDGQASQKTAYSFTASWNPASSQFDGSGKVSYTDFYSNTYTAVNNTATAPYNPVIPQYFINRIATTRTLSTFIRKTKTSTGYAYDAIESTDVTYVNIVTDYTSTVFSSIKTTTFGSTVYWNVQGLSQTFNIEWLGYAGGGAQNLGLIYTSTGESKDISEYATILIETDSFSSSNQRDVFSYGSSFSNEFAEDTYTLTYDIITNSEALTQTTTLQIEPLSLIDSFYYGFIKSNTANTIFYTAGKSSESVELTSTSAGFVFTYNTIGYTVSGVSYTGVQTISTTSNFTQFVELSGLNKATSFVVRGFVTTTAPFTYRNNAAGATAADLFGTPDGRLYSFAPVFRQSALAIRTPQESNPDTFYTEKASFASFADPDYSIAYNGYSPADCSLVFLALVPLNSPDGYEGGQYPSWISVYNGTFAGDRASTSNQSVTVSQSSSYVASGATNVYQTISYFIGNNPASQTTRTKSVAMALVNAAGSVSRLARTEAENLDSAYGRVNTDGEITFHYSHLPLIPIDGSNVLFTQGLQAGASYNIDRLLINAYTISQSTFASPAVSSFPVSVSGMSPIQRNKFRIDKVYDGSFNSFNVGLFQYATF
jgi:hypothetical protein